jgi:hypothetical protein
MGRPSDLVDALDLSSFMRFLVSHERVGNMRQKIESDEPMSLVSINDQTLRELADAAEVREASRLGLKRPLARARLAGEWKVSFWLLTNFRRKRLKDLRGTVRDKIKSGIVKGIEREIQRLEHELVLVRQSHADLSENKIVQAAAALEQAREFLKGR